VLQDDISHEGKNGLRGERSDPTQCLADAQAFLDRVDILHVELGVLKESGLNLEVKGVDCQASLGIAAAVAVSKDGGRSGWIKKQESLSKWSHQLLYQCGG
jgi:hypothetical protein